MTKKLKEAILDCLTRRKFGQKVGAGQYEIKEVVQMIFHHYHSLGCKSKALTISFLLQKKISQLISDDWHKNETWGGVSILSVAEY